MKPEIINGGRVSTDAAEAEYRISDEENKIEVAIVRGFLSRVLADDAVVDRVNDLLFDHVVQGRLHRDVVAGSLPAYIKDIISAATFEDWQAIADQLIAEARELTGAEAA